MLKNLRKYWSKRLGADEVSAAYRSILGREPESDKMISLQIETHDNVCSLISDLIASPEFTARMARHGAALHSSPEGFRTTLNTHEILERYAEVHPIKRDGFVTDFVGSHTDVSFINGLSALSGRVELLPIPGNFHADTAEWVASLRSIDFAKDRFIGVELGAGWAPWLVNCSLAARRKGISDVRCIGVEADAGHFSFIDRHFAANGFDDSSYRAIHAIVGPKSGVAVFPVPEDPSADWGIQPVFCSNDNEANAIIGRSDFEDYRGFKFTQFEKHRILSLYEIMDGLSKVDLLHIDIQGHEFQVVEASLPLLADRVCYMVIGTHSRSIEGDLIRALADSGWVLEVEKPCTFDLGHPHHAVMVDGTQGWRNSRLT
jgi:FkbM family methyltransferase